MKGLMMPLLAIFTLALPGVSMACARATDTSYWHRQAPPENAGIFAARVVITSSARTEGDEDIVEGRIVRLLEGRYSGRSIRLQFDRRTRPFCWVLPAVGERGVIVGHFLSADSDAIVIRPLRTDWTQRNLGTDQGRAGTPMVGLVRAGGLEPPRAKPDGFSYLPRLSPPSRALLPGNGLFGVWTIPSPCPRKEI